MKNTIEEKPLPESEVIACLWQGLMSAVDWSARADQIEGLALREVTVRFLSSFHIVKERFLTVIRLWRPEICSDSRAVLQRPQDGGSADQQRASVLLRRYAYHEGVPADSQGELLAL